MKKLSDENLKLYKDAAYTRGSLDGEMFEFSENVEDDIQKIIIEIAYIRGKLERVRQDEL